MRARRRSKSTASSSWLPPLHLVQIQMLRLVNRFGRDRLSQIAARPGHRHRKNHPEGKCKPKWFPCHEPPPGNKPKSPGRIVGTESGEMCELFHTSLVCPKNAWARRGPKNNRPLEE